MKIERLKLTNFKSIDNAELQLDGKSTILFGRIYGYEIYECKDRILN